MKFMKLGSKPDIFVAHGNVTSVASDLPSDITLNVDGHKFHLHKFPLLVKWGSLPALLAAAPQQEGEDSAGKAEEVALLGFPGGVGCFEMCAKFCYGIAVTVSPHNAGELRCAAEFLHMTEAAEKGNLIHKLEVFLNSSILRGWKDAIICAQCSKAHMPWCEDLKIIGRCLDAISSKASADPAKVDWSFTYTRPFMLSLLQQRPVSEIQQSGMAAWDEVQICGVAAVPRDWWVEDVAQLDIELYRRVMVAIKAKGMSREVVGEAVRVYALKWLPGVSTAQTVLDNAHTMLGGGDEESMSSEDTCCAAKNRHLLETLVSLLPAERGACSCSFLLKLLRAAAALDASPATRTELARRVGAQLEDASPRDLLILSQAVTSYAGDAAYDVNLVACILEHYLLQDQSPPTSPPAARGARSPRPAERRRALSAESVELNGSHHRMTTAATHSSKLKVAKLIDRYLAEIARDPNLPLLKFMHLAEAVPDFARTSHDGLYRAVDMYLKEHPGLSKSERKRICRLMDCRKLSMEACMHVAQNDRLPLRVVVQVLYFEQVRTAVNRGFLISDPTAAGETPVPQAHNHNGSGAAVPSAVENWESVHNDFTALKGDLASIKLRIAAAERERGGGDKHPTKVKGVLSAFKPERILNKLFPNKAFSSSESSRDSASPELAAAAKPTPAPGLRHSFA